MGGVSAGEKDGRSECWGVWPCIEGLVMAGKYGHF